VTLIVTEVAYDPDNKDASRILCAADRRLSLDGVSITEVRKLFKNSRLNATVSYFGLSVTDTNAWTFEEILSKFVQTDTASTLEAFAMSLMLHLTSLIPKHVLKQHASRLHVTGFTDRQVPQLWFIRNIGGLDGLIYKEFKDHYWLSEELSQVHASELYDKTSSDYLKSRSRRGSRTAI
jgi:hypothetical protein